MSGTSRHRPYPAHHAGLEISWRLEVDAQEGVGRSPHPSISAMSLPRGTE